MRCFTVPAVKYLCIFRSIIMGDYIPRRMLLQNAYGKLPEAPTVCAACRVLGRSSTNTVELCITRQQTHLDRQSCQTDSFHARSSSSSSSTCDSWTDVDTRRWPCWHLSQSPLECLDFPSPVVAVFASASSEWLDPYRHVQVSPARDCSAHRLWRCP